MNQKLREINLLQGVTAKKLKLPPAIKFEVSVEVDDTLAKLIKDGKEGLRWQTLQDAADNAAEPIKKLIKEVARLDAKLPSLSPEEQEKMIAVTNHALSSQSLRRSGSLKAHASLMT